MMEKNKRTRRIALIPAYMPDKILSELVMSLYMELFDIVVIDDGSPKSCDLLFERISPYVTLLRHDVNKGKGEAIKTGLRYIKNTYTVPYVVVCVDADGQHRIEDVANAAEMAAVEPDSLVLGSRYIDSSVPFRSRLGNTITRGVYRFVTRKKVYDTQTGLRAFSCNLVDDLIKVKGERYEYEMNVLLEFSKPEHNIIEIWIDTVYINNNSASHFRPFKDSVIIYKRIFAFALTQVLMFSASSVVSFLLDYGLFCLMTLLGLGTTLSNVFARVVSGGVNFTLNRSIVFRSKDDVVVSAVKYIFLACSILVINTLILNVLTHIGINVYAAKIITESVMFVISYVVQHVFIFGRRGEQE